MTVDLSRLNAEVLQKMQAADLVRWLSVKSLAPDSGLTPSEYWLREHPNSLSQDIALRAFDPRHLAEKAAIEAGSTTVPAWGGSLVNGAPKELVSAFLPLLEARSTLLQLPLRRVPFNTKIAAETSGASFSWVSENHVKPITKFAFSNITVPPTKIAGPIVLTRELVKLAAPGSVGEMQNQLVNGATAFIDAQFLDPAVAAVAGQTPASITAGLTPIATGATVDATVAAVVKAFWAALPTASAQSALVMAPGTASGLTSSAQPNVGTDGGRAFGMTVYTTPSAGNRVVALDPSRVLVAREPQPVLDASEEATIELAAPATDPPGAATVMVSLFQANLIAIRCEWLIGWLTLPNSVQYAVMP